MGLGIEEEDLVWLDARSAITSPSSFTSANTAEYVSALFIILQDTTIVLAFVEASADATNHG